MYKIVNRSAILLSILGASIIFYFFSSSTYYMHGDALGYYMYLPATFIYHNNKHLETLPADKDIYWGVQVGVQSLSKQKTPLGYTQQQYTYGIALTDAPFFFIAHAYEKLTGGKANGYSPTYNLMLIIASLTYAVLGLIITYKVLRRYFGNTQALIATLLIFWATNLLWFALFQGGMAHAPLFFLYALLILLTIQLHERPRLSMFLVIGFTAGLITIIRPTDVLCALIPLLYNVHSRETFRDKIQLIKSNIKGIALLAVAFIIPIIPQLLYWKALAGSYLFYSYGDQSFHWLKPHIIEGLFFFKNGWLPYAPIMIFALAGLFFYRRITAWFWCIAAILPLYIYIIYSWYCYNYINGLGSRPMIHLYPLLAIPLTAFISYLAQRRLLVKVAFAAICLFFTSMNICYCMQKTKGILNSEESNIVYNLQMLYRMHVKYNDLVAYDIAETQPDSSKISALGPPVYNHFDDSLTDKYMRDTVFGSKYMYHMTDDENSPEVIIKYNKQTFKDAKWLKCSGKFYYISAPGYFKHLMVVRAGDKFWEACKIENKIAFYDTTLLPHFTLEDYHVNTWGNVSFYIKIPHHLKDGDEIKLNVWNTGKRDLYMDDLSLQVYK